MFITLEGIDGCGKSVQAEKLCQWLQADSPRRVLKTFEPGGYPDGGRMREFILSSQIVSPKAELLMFLADRAEHAERLIEPTLESGHNVVCERWNESTLAYQAGGRKLDLHEVRSIIAACRFPEPDLKIFLDVAPETAFNRVLERKKSDKFEKEGLAFMRTVAGAYRELAQSGELTRIDCGDMNEDEVFMQIVSVIKESSCRYR